MLVHDLTIEDINNLESDSFFRIFSNIVERCIDVGAALLKLRPFKSIDEMIAATEDYLDQLKLTEKEKILQLYPDIISTFTCFSHLSFEFTTHRNIVINSSTSNLKYTEKRRLKDMSLRYMDRYGFPFIFCSNERDICKIYSAIEDRLVNDKSKEIDIALNEVKKISKIRIYEMVK